MPGSVVSTRSRRARPRACRRRRRPCRRAASSRCRRRRRGGRDTQVAPAAVLSSALRIGQSAIASEPSRIASVSRLGEATEPASRWSRPMTIGASTSPRRTSSLKARPGLGALAVAEPADARRQPLEGDLLAARRRSSGAAPRRRGTAPARPVGRCGDVGGVAGERRPAERALALAEERADVRGHEAGDVEGVGHAAPRGEAAQVVAVVEGDRAARAGSASIAARAAPSSPARAT